ncbi:MraZ family transcriptional regulator [Mycoplasmopsis synoviae]|uniref:Transcriptional regulator MraZ n=1 Tax=Mycoplasmopsis synoviae TaxID=2109 RepID=A0AAX3F317_MYCSY|nr:MraZ family transcriptional regulator [Mycoplasmopsis synoviae]AKB11081.1 MraZ family transcriptional regulator [Mycoplasmopsis synoviae ATCC 25204]MBD5788643.1 hypothetical protein [Mycoplasmopsis synoviae GX11-T]QGL45023.1 MraZ family transcriptional regulator [Mycoplasmopsis synoviae]QXV99758.1 MraZ family transcriptional regulator [Mycoplasmopsis synoviae]UBM43953.1 MraZ family transcriptional regulator [Mycoplasmopsis synoviae]
MVFGQQLRNLDEKNRIALPPAFKSKLVEPLYLTIGFDGQADLRSEKEFEKFSAFLDQKNPFDAKIRQIKRQINSNTFEITLDKQGRITIPARIMQWIFAGEELGKEIYFVGAKDYVEIWSKSKFEALNEKVTPVGLEKLVEQAYNEK